MGLYDNLPGFNAFREASKFYVLIALGYAVGIASLVEWLLPPEVRTSARTEKVGGLPKEKRSKE